ncbi:hypothetical protein ACFY7V_33835 [[Kitasatospora] papulosa]|uniref:hypothetical protein n=1 Tax=Streptomyces TaxID=1883 RepID=UPI002FEE7EDF
MPDHAHPRPAPALSGAWPGNFTDHRYDTDCPMCTNDFTADDIGWGLLVRRGEVSNAYLWRSGQVRGARIAARGPLNRFHRDPTAPRREVVLYRAAAQTLMTAGVKVLTVNTGEATPSEVAATIADAVSSSSIASTGSPTTTTSQGP